MNHDANAKTVAIAIGMILAWLRYDRGCSFMLHLSLPRDLSQKTMQDLQDLMSRIPHRVSHWDVHDSPIESFRQQKDTSLNSCVAFRHVKKGAWFVRTDEPEKGNMVVIGFMHSQHFSVPVHLEESCYFCPNDGPTIQTKLEALELVWDRCDRSGQCFVGWLVNG